MCTCPEQPESLAINRTPLARAKRVPVTDGDKRFSVRVRTRSRVALLLSATENPRPIRQQHMQNCATVQNTDSQAALAARDVITSAAHEIVVGSADARGRHKSVSQ